MNRQRSMISFRPSLLDLHYIDEIKDLVTNEKGIILNLTEIMRYSLQETLKTLRARSTNDDAQSD